MVLLGDFLALKIQLLMSHTKVIGAQTTKSVRCIYQPKVDGCLQQTFTRTFPSVHTWWSSPASPQGGVTWFYNEITLKKTADNSYFMTNGFTGGYMGIQDRSPKWKILDGRQSECIS